jgi:acyl carrier protein
MTTPFGVRLEEIFRAVFELPTDANVTQLRQLSTPKWDSLAHVSLVTAIESEFGLSIDAADQLRMTSYAATMVLLEERSA